MQTLFFDKGMSCFQITYFDENYNPPSSPFRKGGKILPPFGKGSLEGFFCYDTSS
jgi:hypothetical protein